MSVWKLGAPPTAVQKLADTHDTAVKPLLKGPGLGTTDQVVPSHDSTRGYVFPLALAEYVPTAVQRLADTHDTADNLSVLATFGLGITDHVLPFHDAIRVLWPYVCPATMQKLAGTHDTPLRVPCGGCVTDQVVPFHDSASGGTAPRLPTARQALAEAHDTALNWLLPEPSFGVCITDQGEDPVRMALRDAAGLPAASAGPADIAATATAAQTASTGRVLGRMPPFLLAAPA
jgi:hypothetical protein